MGLSVINWGGVVASSLSESSTYPLQTGVATKEITRLDSMDAEIKALRATLSTYGLTKLSTANDVTDANAAALSAVEKNINIAGSLGNQIQTINNHLVQHQFIQYREWNKTEAVDLLDNPTKLVGNHTCPYVLIFHDNVGDSPLGGGYTCIFGYCYDGDMYGAQLRIKYDLSMSNFARSKYDGCWTEWYPLRN